MRCDDRTHTLQTRAVHWLNALLVLSLLWTGFSMFAGDRHFAFYVRLLPAWLWDAIRLPASKRSLFTWHTYLGALFAINGCIYAASLALSGAWKRVVVRRTAGWTHDPRRPLAYSMPQRLAYTIVLGAAAVMVATGLALWFKHQIPWLLVAFGGERIALPIHVVLATGLIAFALVHVAQVLRAGPVTLRSMTIGQVPTRRSSASDSFDTRILRTR